jgi:DNA-directed RNA polymerase specialized sigma subunit
MISSIPLGLCIRLTLINTIYASIAKDLQLIPQAPVLYRQVEWRRAKVLELMSKGEINQSEIGRILQVDRSIVCRDVAYLRQQAREHRQICR